MALTSSASRFRRTGARLHAPDIMTTRVIMARSDTSIKDLVAIMATYRISGIPIVTSDNELVGIVTEGDLLYKEVDPKPTGPSGFTQRLPLPLIAAAADRARKAEGLRAEEIMTTPVVTVTEAATVHEIAGLMVKHRINRIPVVRDGRVVGIVSRADVLKAFNRPDRELADAIRHSILHDLLIDPGGVSVEVRDGVVYLDGRLDRRSEKELVEKWAGMTDGVLAVQSRLTYEVDDRKIKPVAPRR